MAKDYLNRNTKEVSCSKLLEDSKIAGISGTLELIYKKFKVYGTPVENN